MKRMAVAFTLAALPLAGSALTWGEELKQPSVNLDSRTLPYYELPTDVQDLTATDPDFLRVSDEDIDKAIDEIKAALRKNVPQRK